MALLLHSRHELKQANSTAGLSVFSTLRVSTVSPCHTGQAGPQIVNVNKKMFLTHQYELLLFLSALMEVKHGAFDMEGGNVESRLLGSCK